MAQNEPQPDFAVTDANPLYSFRAPARLPKIHAPVHGGHFITRVEDVVNDTSSANIYPGYFRLRANPSIELDIKLWHDKPNDDHSWGDFQKMTLRDHFAVAMFKEFDIQERIRPWWKKDVSGRITLGGRAEHTFVVMWRTGEQAEAAEAKLLVNSNHVQQSVEEKMAASAATQSTALGMEVTASVTIEEDEKQ